MAHKCTWLLGLTFVALTLLAGCKVSPQDVPGRYTCDHGFAKEELVIFANGEFRQTVYLKEPLSELRGRGKWRFNPEDQRITFESGLILAVDPFGNRSTNLEPFDGPVSLPFEPSLGRIRIMLIETVYYKKR